MILLGISLGIIVALLRGGKLKRLGRLELKGIPLVFFSILLRNGAGFLSEQGFVYASWLQVAAYPVLFYVLLINTSYPGMNFFGLGTLMNFLVIIANKGTMPVSAQAISIAGLGEPSGMHSVLSEQTPLWFFADIIPVSFPVASVVSVGDILIVAGIFIFIQYRMRTPRIKEYSGRLY